jgi:hypothetical protein
MEKQPLAICTHFDKMTLNHFNEKIYNRDTLFCNTCYSSHQFKKSKEGQDLSNLLVCLICFKVCCNRQTENQCMLKHGEKKTHEVTYSLSSGAIWCYGCDNELKQFQIEKGLNGDTNEIKKVLSSYPKETKKAYELIEYTKAVDENFNKLIEKNKKMMIKQQSEQIDRDNEQIEEEEKEQETLKGTLASYIIFS